MSRVLFEKLSRAERASLVAVGLVVFHTLVKFAIARTSQSLAVTAEAYHSLADVLTSVMVFVSLRFDRHLRSETNLEPTGGERANRSVEATEESRPAEGEGDGPTSPADPTEGSSPTTALSGGNDGPGLVEHLVSAGIGLFIAVMAVTIMVKAVTGRIPQVTNPLLGGVVLLGLGVISFLVSTFELRLAGQTGSLALKADAYHNRIDMWACFIVGGGLVLQALFGWNLDRPAAAFVALILISLAVDLFANQYKALKADLAGGDRVRLGVVLDSGLLAGSREWTTRLLAKGRAGLIIKRAPRWGLWCAVIGLLGWWLSTAVVVVGFQEAAIVERLGRASRTPLRPGLHLVLPAPIDRVRRVNVKLVRQINLGFERELKRKEVLWTGKHMIGERQYLSGDQNLLAFYLAVHYQVGGPFRYLYSSRKPELILTQSCYRHLIQEVGRRTFFDATTTGRRSVERALLSRVRRDLDALKTGLRVVNLFFRDLHPPTRVAAHFQEVVTAQEEIVWWQNLARTFKIETMARSHGKAARMQSSAHAYRNKVVTDARAGARRRLLLLEVARTSARQLAFSQYLEAMTRFHKRARLIIVDHRLKGLDLWLEGE